MLSYVQSSSISEKIFYFILELFQIRRLKQETYPNIFAVKPNLHKLTRTGSGQPSAWVLNYFVLKRRINYDLELDLIKIRERQVHETSTRSLSQIHVNWIFIPEVVNARGIRN